ncbi:MAG: hypothetical protein LBD25_04005 [Coriobacteriales bacterium]|nr:hypothetical protein [Coriobacteriales bacterium]
MAVVTPLQHEAQPVQPASAKPKRLPLIIGGAVAALVVIGLGAFGIFSLVNGASGGGNPLSFTPTANVAIEDVTVTLGDYKAKLIGIDDDSKVTLAEFLTPPADKKFIRVEVGYLSGGTQGGFSYSDIKKLLKDHPLLFKDAAGNDYMSDQTFVTHKDYGLGLVGSNGLYNAYTRFGFLLAVPKGTSIEDLVLEYDGSLIPLKSMALPTS